MFLAHLWKIITIVLIHMCIKSTVIFMLQLNILTFRKLVSVLTGYSSTKAVITSKQTVFRFSIKYSHLQVPDQIIVLPNKKELAISYNYKLQHNYLKKKLADFFFSLCSGRKVFRIETSGIRVITLRIRVIGCFLEPHQHIQL